MNRRFLCTLLVLVGIKLLVASGKAYEFNETVSSPGTVNTSVNESYLISQGPFQKDDKKCNFPDLPPGMQAKSVNDFTLELSCDDGMEWSTHDTHTVPSTCMGQHWIPSPSDLSCVPISSGSTAVIIVVVIVIVLVVIIGVGVFFWYQKNSADKPSSRSTKSHKNKNSLHADSSKKLVIQVSKQV